VINSEYADIRVALPDDKMSEENLIDGIENRLKITLIFAVMTNEHSQSVLPSSSLSLHFSNDIKSIRKFF
jgi:hypothetical protein